MAGDTGGGPPTTGPTAEDVRQDALTDLREVINSAQEDLEAAEELFEDGAPTDVEGLRMVMESLHDSASSAETLCHQLQRYDEMAEEPDSLIRDHYEGP